MRLETFCIAFLLPFCQTESIRLKRSVFDLITKVEKYSKSEVGKKVGKRCQQVFSMVIENQHEQKYTNLISKIVSSLHYKKRRACLKQRIKQKMKNTFKAKQSRKLKKYRKKKKQENVMINFTFLTKMTK